MITAKRLNYILIAIFVILIAAGVGLTLFVSDWLKAKSDGIVAIKLDTAALEEQKKTAIQAESDLNKYATTKESIERIIPKSKDQARAVAELLQIANDVNANISSITFPTSDLGIVQKSTAPATTDSSSGDSSSSNSTPAAEAPKTPAISQAKPVEGLSGILGVDVIVTQIDTKGVTPGSGMSYPQLIEFLRAVERNRRTMQVKSIQIQPIRAGGAGAVTGYGLTLNLTIFVKP